MTLLDGLTFNQIVDILILAFGVLFALIIVLIVISTKRR